MIQNGAHWCSKILRVDDVASHEKECEFARIPCPIAGCSTMIMRRDLPRHLERSMGQHMALLRAELDGKNAELLAVTGRLAEAEKKLGGMGRKMANLALVVLSLMEDRAADPGSRQHSTTRTRGNRQPRVWKFDERRQVLTEIMDHGLGDRLNGSEDSMHRAAMQLMMSDAEEEDADGNGAGLEVSSSDDQPVYRPLWAPGWEVRRNIFSTRPHASGRSHGNNLGRGIAPAVVRRVSSPEPDEDVDEDANSDDDDSASDESGEGEDFEDEEIVGAGDALLNVNSSATPPHESR